MAGRGDVVHPGRDLAPLLHEAGSGGDRWKAIFRGGHCALLERIGHRRSRHVRFELLASPVVPLGVNEHECRLREGGRACLGDEATDVIEVSMRHDHKVDALGSDPGALEVRLKFREIAESGTKLLSPTTIDKDALASSVNDEDVAGSLNHGLHEVRPERGLEVSFRRVRRENRSERDLPVTVRDYRGLKVADPETIVATTVLRRR